MKKRDRGSALAVTLVLLSGLGALALGAAAAAMAALALAGHAQDVELAHEAAEAGIVEALAFAANERGPGASADRAWPGDAGPQATVRTRTEPAAGGAFPEGFSIGEGADAFASQHYFIVADAQAGRAAAVRLEQGFYLVVPAS